VRYLGNSSETAKRLMTLAWQCLRPELLGRAAVVPRIWNT
jgi:urease accessory protein